MSFLVNSAISFDNENVRAAKAHAGKSAIAAVANSTRRAMQEISNKVKKDTAGAPNATKKAGSDRVAPVVKPLASRISVFRNSSSIITAQNQQQQRENIINQHRPGMQIMTRKQTSQLLKEQQQQIPQSSQQQQLQQHAHFQDEEDMSQETMDEMIIDHEQDDDDAEQEFQLAPEPQQAQAETGKAQETRVGHQVIDMPAAVASAGATAAAAAASAASAAAAVPAIAEIPANVFDIDAECVDDLQYVGHYAAEIYEHLRDLEQTYAINPNYMSFQTEATPRMRGILVHWLCQVHSTWPFKQETLYLAVHIMDRFLQKRLVQRTRFQLVGLTSFLVAAKYEEIYIPEISEFLQLTKNLYAKEDVLQMECEILATLAFNLGTPSPLHFLRRAYRAAPCGSKTYTFAKYMCELSLCNYNMVGFAPSKIAASAMYVARRLTCPSEPAWDESLEYYLWNSADELRACSEQLINILRVAHTEHIYEVIYERFSAEGQLRVARIPMRVSLEIF